MKIKEKYRNFLRKLVDEKYLQKYPDCQVLGDGFIDGYYIVIFEYTDKSILEALWKKNII